MVVFCLVWANVWKPQAFLCFGGVFAFYFIWKIQVEGVSIRRVLETLNPLTIKRLTFLFYFGSLLEENTYVIKTL